MMSSPAQSPFRERLLMDEEADRGKEERVKNGTDGGRREIIKE